MNGLTLVCIAIIVFACGYLFYGRWLVKTWGIDPDAKTPAYRFEMAAILPPHLVLRFLPTSFLLLPVQAL